MCGGVEADVVGNVSELNYFSFLQAYRVEELNAFALAVRDGNEIHIRQNGDPLGLTES